MNQHIKYVSTAGIIFSVVLFVCVIIITVHPMPLYGSQSLSHVTNFEFQNKTIFLSLMSGAIVGFSLGFIGSGGSILAIPLLLYVVGVEDPHAAIGTSALAVSINAATNLFDHARKRNVIVREGLTFALPGVVGTVIGTQLGLLTPPGNLVFFFALLMFVIAARMLLNNSARKDLLDNHESIRRLVGFSKFTNYRKSNFLSSHRLKLMGLFVGLAAGYFGIGGGFLIVPTLLYSGLNISNAIGTSLIPVSIFGATTALGYSFQNHINIVISLLFAMGGIGGGLIGSNMLHRIPKNIATNAFAIVIVVVGAYIILRSFLI